MKVFEVVLDLAFGIGAAALGQIGHGGKITGLLDEIPIGEILGVALHDRARLGIAGEAEERVGTHESHGLGQLRFGISIGGEPQKGQLGG